MRGAARFDVGHQICNAHPVVQHLDHRIDAQSDLQSSGDELLDRFVKAGAILSGIHAATDNIRVAVGASGWL